MSKFFVSVFSFLILYLLAAAGSAVVAQPTTTTAAPPLNWYKGNTHTHTLNSDGNSTPDQVVRWYRENGYNFLVLTDHNFVTNVDGLNALHGADGKFIVVRGEEVTDSFGGKPVHINALNLAQVVKPQSGKTLVETMQRNVNAVRAAGGVPYINHPNFEWTIAADDLRQVENVKLFEIFNGHPLVNNFGGGGKPSLEEMWDALLSSGKLLYAIALDDAHDFKNPGNKTSAQPGLGWVVVRAAQLAPAAIFEAMERGDFYASTGVELTDYQANEKSISVTIREQRASKYRVQFIGSGGRVLREEITNPAVYKIRGDEGYVRAKVLESNGKVAWTQPVMIKER